MGSDTVFRRNWDCVGVRVFVCVIPVQQNYTNLYSMLIGWSSRHRIDDDDPYQLPN